MHDTRGSVPQRLGILFSPSVHTRQHPANVAVDDRISPIKPDAQNGAGHILADSGELNQDVIIARNSAPVLLHNDPGSGQQVFCAAVVTETGPQREDALFVSAR